MGIPHMGIFESPCPFPYGNHHMETVIPVWKTFPYGDFYLNPQMGMNSIRKRVSDWTVPVRKRGSIPFASPYGNRDRRSDSISIWLCVYPHFHMVITMWKRGAMSSGSLYGNGDSPFPYGDVSIPVSIWRSPYGNEEPFHSAPYMETGITIWKWGFPRDV